MTFPMSVIWPRGRIKNWIEFEVLLIYKTIYTVQLPLIVPWFIVFPHLVLSFSDPKPKISISKLPPFMIILSVLFKSTGPQRNLTLGFRVKKCTYQHYDSHLKMRAEQIPRMPSVCNKAVYHLMSTITKQVGLVVTLCTSIGRCVDGVPAILTEVFLGVL
jgi:hypothetical protein